MFILNFIQNVYAAAPCPADPAQFDPNLCPAKITGGTYNLETVFSNIVTVIAGAAALAFFVMLVIAGLKLVFAQGDPKKISSASSTITWAFLGIIFIVLAWLIINLIGTFTGRIGTDAFTIFRIGTGR